MGQEHKEYTWNLIAKKLTGEASPEELLQLEALLRGNPELHYPMQTMTDCWKSSNPEDQKMAERAFDRHLDRMEDLQIDYLPASASSEDAINNITGGSPSPNVPEGRSTRWKSKRKKTLIVSTFCLLAIAGFFFIHSGPKPPLIGLNQPTPLKTG